MLLEKIIIKMKYMTCVQYYPEVLRQYYPEVLRQYQPRLAETMVFHTRAGIPDRYNGFEIGFGSADDHKNIFRKPGTHRRGRRLLCYQNTACVPGKHKESPRI